MWLAVEKGEITERVIDLRSMDKKFSPKIKLAEVTNLLISELPGEQDLDLMLLGTPTTLKNTSLDYKKSKTIKIFREFRKELRKISFQGYKDTFLHDYDVIPIHKYFSILSSDVIKYFNENIETNQDITEYNRFITKREELIEDIKIQLIKLFNISSQLLKDEELPSEILEIIFPGEFAKTLLDESTDDVIAFQKFTESKLEIKHISEEIALSEIPVEIKIGETSSEEIIDRIDHIKDISLEVLSVQEEEIVEKSIVEKDEINDFEVLLIQNMEIIEEIYNHIQNGGKIEPLEFSNKKGIGRPKIIRILERIRIQIKKSRNKDLVQKQRGKKEETIYLESKKPIDLNSFDKYILDDEAGICSFLMSSDYFHNNLLISADMIAYGMNLEKSKIISILKNIKKTCDFELTKKNELREKYFVKKQDLSKLPSFSELIKIVPKGDKDLIPLEKTSEETKEKISVKEQAFSNLSCKQCYNLIKNFPTSNTVLKKTSFKSRTFCPKTHRLITHHSQICEKYRTEITEDGRIIPSCYYCKSSVLLMKSRKIKLLCSHSTKVVSKRYFKIRNTERTARSCSLFTRRKLL